MFTSFTLNAEIARQRQACLQARSERHRRRRGSKASALPTVGVVIELPTPLGDASRRGPIAA